MMHFSIFVGIFLSKASGASRVGLGVLGWLCQRILAQWWMSSERFSGVVSMRLKMYLHPLQVSLLVLPAAAKHPAGGSNGIFEKLKVRIIWFCMH